MASAARDISTGTSPDPNQWGAGKADAFSAATFLSGSTAPSSPSLAASPASGPPPLSVTFTASAVPGTGTLREYLWDYTGSGYTQRITPAGGNTTSFTYITFGTFTAAVTMANTAGRTATGTATVTVTTTTSTPPPSTPPSSTPGPGPTGGGKGGCGCTMADPGGPGPAAGSIVLLVVVLLAVKLTGFRPARGRGPGP